VEQHLGQFVLGPALPQGKADVQRELRLAAHAGIGDDADQRAQLGVDPGTRPQRAEHGLGRDIDEFFHHWVAVDFARRFLDRSITHQLPPHRRALFVKFALRHLTLAGW